MSAKKLQEMLERWERAGLISAQQSQAIAAAEAAQSKNVPWIWGIGAVGVFAVLGGVISLIAANWEEISDSTKLICGVGLLIAVAWCARQLARRDNPWASDLFLLAHQGLVLGVIALVAQIFHISGDPWRPFAIAAAFAMVAAHAGQHLFLMHSAIAIALVAVGTWCAERNLSFADTALLVLALGGFFAAARVLLLRVSAVARYAAACNHWTFLSLLFATILAVFGWEMGATSMFDRASHPAITACALLLMIIAVIVNRSLLQNAATSALIGLGVMHFAGGITNWLGAGLFRQLLGFGVFAAFATAWIVVMGQRGDKRAVNFGLFALSLRILIAFFQVFDTLTTTGISLLLTGGALIGCAIAWRRVSERVLALSKSEGTKP